MIHFDFPPGITVVPFAPWHIAALDPRGPDAAQIRSIDRLAYGREIADAFQCQTIMRDGRPLCCWGLCEYPPHVLIGFLAADVALDRFPVSIWKFSRAVFREAIARPEVNRIEFNLPLDHHRSIRWLERLGFHYEGTRRCYGFNGEDCLMYGLTK